MPGLQSRCKQSKRRDYRKINVVTHANKLRAPLRVDLCDGAFIAGIELHEVRIFIDDLWLVIAHFIDLVGDLVEVRLLHDHANQFSAAELHSLAGISNPGYSERFARSSLIGKRIK